MWDELPAQQCDYRHRAKRDELVGSEGATAFTRRDQLRDVGVDRHQLDAQGNSGDKAPQIGAEAGGLEGQDQGGDRISDQRPDEDGASAEPVRGRAENDAADEQPGESCENESAGAGHAEPCQPPEDAERSRGEQPGITHPGNNVGREEEIIELEHPAKRQQQDHGPHVTGRRQPIQPGRDFRCSAR